MNPPRVTQRDIAKAAGVSHVTVSLALRDSPTIPEVTRDQIKVIAKRLGYSPDPMLAALSSYRKQQRPATHQANIAWLYSHSHASSAGWGDFGNYYRGAEMRATHLGYVLDEINIGSEYSDSKRLRRLLDARNITGLILAPSSPNSALGNEFKFDFARYSAVRIGYSYRTPLLNTVANAQFRTTLTAVQKVVAMGYQRIGTILTKEVDQRTSWHFLGGYLAGIHMLPRKNWIDPFYCSPKHDFEQAFCDWLEKQKIDCVVAAGYGALCHAMIKRGMKVPEEIGYVDTQLGAEDDFFSGIHQNARQIGIAAVDQLVSMMHRYEVGLPDPPSHVLIEGSWHEGKTATLRPPLSQ